MQTTARSADVLLFHCTHCHTELSVPLSLQGVVGPCPCCGEQIQAPIPASRSPQPSVANAPIPAPALHLPPLDGTPEAYTLPVPLPHWMNALPSAATVPSVSANPDTVSRPLARHDGADRITPRQLSEHASLGFSARHSIPQSEAPLDDSWREKHLDDRRRNQSLKKLDRATDRFFGSRTWSHARTGLLIATGGICAGLGIYLQDRNWVLELPWRPDPAAAAIRAPITPSAVRSRALPSETDAPFLAAEDPSDLEATPRRASLMPIPDVQTSPVSASPIAAGKK